MLFMLSVNFTFAANPSIFFVYRFLLYFLLLWLEIWQKRGRRGNLARGGVTNDLHKTNNFMMASVVILKVTTCQRSCSVMTYH